MAETKENSETPPPKQVVSPGPHLTTPESVPAIMWTVVATLLPAGAVGVYFFGWPALAVIAVCVAAAMAAEYVGERLVLGRKDPSLLDGSAFLTGLLLAYCLPPAIPLWKAAVGAALAIFIAKTVFGGLGHNIFNPALIGRAILLAAWPVAMTTWTLPPESGALVPEGLFGVDAITGATPLNQLKGALDAAARAKEVLPISKLTPTVADIRALFFGNVQGCIGETSALALLVGGIWLLWRRIITWHVPVVYTATVFVLSVVIQIPRAVEAGGSEGLTLLLNMGLFQILAGGLFLGAWFMATDMVTSPMTGKGKVIFAAGAGILVVLIRNLGGYPEGVCYSILLMNMAVPLIDRFTKPRKFGFVKKA
ncbi:MAG: RnfABCDGE type electron transport complex subunit D [Planctomycetota bacterium]|jgi:electron transport complex protein RnfD